MLTAIADQLEKSQRDHDTVAQHFSALLTEIAETLQGEPRLKAFRDAHNALETHASADTQLAALHAVRDSIRQ